MNPRTPARGVRLSPVRQVPAVSALLLLALVWNAQARNPDDETGKSIEIKTSMGDVHVGNDADLRETGLPLYPGAHLKKDDRNQNSANLSLLTSAFGMKLVVLNYVSDDAPEKIIAYYREKLRKFGTVLECHSSAHPDDVEISRDEHDSNALKCDSDDSGRTLELKVGTNQNAHIVGVEPARTGKGSTFAIVYVRTHGKQADI